MSTETLKFFEEKNTEEIINWMLSNLSEDQIRMCLDQSGIPDTSVIKGKQPIAAAAAGSGPVATITLQDGSQKQLQPGEGSSSGQLHEARHFQYSRRMITPTHPVEGDWLKIETEEAIFGLLFAWMGFWLFKQLRGLWRYWAEAKARAAMEPTGVKVVDDRAVHSALPSLSPCWFVL